jgi:hypothetical protein
MATLGSLESGLGAFIRRRVRRWMFRWLLNEMPMCTGGGCCSYCPHVLIQEARESFEKDKLLPHQDEMTWWQVLRWWWWTWVERPLLGRCSWCGTPLTDDDDDPRIGDMALREQRFGIRSMCYGCVHYPEG